MAQTITSETFETLLTDGKPVMIAFSASWCGPCKRIAPFVDTLAEKYAEQAHVVKCDIEESEDLALRYGYYRTVPSMLLVPVVLLIAFVQAIQVVFSRLSARIDKRLR